ncbi:MAG: septum formation initiator family protein [Pseudomonadota bacterium]|nr:septum formation initiator family protein [Pseudomonadota bacterium]
MSIAHEIKRRSRRMIFPIVGALFVCYFLVQAFQGDRGIIAWMHLQKQVNSAKQTLNETKMVRRKFEHHIELLRTAHLDRDMLDERTRVMTGLMKSDEFIVIFKEP